MQSVARILTANLAAPQPKEPDAEISSAIPGNECVYECPHCRDSGRRQADLPGRAGAKQCECVAGRARARYLALNPRRMKRSSS